MCINDIVFVPDYCEIMKDLIFSKYQRSFNNNLFFFFSMSVWNQMNSSRHLLVIILLKPQSGKDCCLKSWRTCCLQERSMCSELICLRAKVIQWKVKLKNHKIIAKKKCLTGCFRAKDDLKKETDPFKKKVIVPPFCYFEFLNSLNMKSNLLYSSHNNSCNQYFFLHHKMNFTS